MPANAAACFHTSALHPAQYSWPGKHDKGLCLLPGSRFPGVLLPLFQAEQHLRTFFKTSLTIFPCCGIVIKSTIWARSSAGSASVSLLCPTELWAFKWGVCRLVAQPRHAPKYGPIAQLGERSVRIREVKGSNPSRSTNLPHRFVRCGVFYVQKTLADRAGLRTLKSDANRAGASMYFLKIHQFHASFFAFCRVLRASASLLCPLLGNFFKNFRTIVG